MDCVKGSVFLEVDKKLSVQRFRGMDFEMNQGNLDPFLPFEYTGFHKAFICVSILACE